MATFACRDTLLPIEAPLALTTQFSQDGAKIAAWRAFTRRNTLNAPELSIVTEQIRNFPMPPSQAAISQGIFMAQWQPGGDWINETYHLG